jgi:hypothetical protein
MQDRTAPRVTHGADEQASESEESARITRTGFAGLPASPGGTLENSPAFQRRVEAELMQVPKGRLRLRCTVPKHRSAHAPQSSLRDFDSLPVFPGVETPGYCHDVPPGQDCILEAKRMGVPHTASAWTLRLLHFSSRHFVGGCQESRMRGAVRKRMRSL